MDILLIGGVSNLVNALIDKLNKEGHRIYLLSGSPFQVPGYRRTFERYNFTYDSTSMGEIFESVHPDVTIFMGAFDTNFTWAHPRREALRLMSGLTNMLISFSLQKTGRFIFLSSQEVFQDAREYNIPEKEPVAPIDLRPITLSNGERLTMDYSNIYGLDTVVLRLDHLCDIPKKRHQVSNICSFMCLEALEKQRLVADDHKIFSLLFLSDAVEFIYRMVQCQKHKNNLYHISASNPVSELQMATWIREVMGEDLAIEDRTNQYERRMILSNLLFDREFHVRIFHKPEDMVKRVATQMIEHRTDFLTKSDMKKHGLRGLLQGLKHLLIVALPFLENLVCFVPFFLLSAQAIGSVYFARLDLFLIYVLLFAIVYGQHQATFSALLSIIGYLVIHSRDASGFSVMLDYNTYVWMAQLFILGLAVGYLKDQINLIKGIEANEVDYLSGQLNDIQDINGSNVRLKNILETQVVNQNDSLGKIYEITSGLDKYEPEEVLFYAAEILSRLVGSPDVAIYSVANRSYARLFSATSAKSRALGNSINYTELTEVYDALKDHKVYINKRLDERYPEMAAAIFSEDEMQLILMVWGIPWERMTLGQSNVLAVIGYLIQNAVLRANRYMEALENQRYVAGTNILESEAFESLVRAYMGARRKNLTECAILSIDTEADQQNQASATLGKLLRASDFLGKLEDGRLYALLSNTNNESAHFVIKRFEDAGYHTYLQEEVMV
ncbi:MAG: NAD(P)-dependent oxidoreductase [Clostridium sp.]|jgi:nucleoside-diphosphate-sugar epimerase|nr:NAD(P)-dependent oxidoreductase [Clostridium sp.]